jgi:hypothetical protein
MRKFAVVVGIALAAASSASAQDPGASLLCLMGAVQGTSGGSSCAGPVADFFADPEMAARPP